MYHRWILTGNRAGTFTSTPIAWNLDQSEAESRLRERAQNKVENDFYTMSGDKRTADGFLMFTFARRVGHGDTAYEEDEGESMEIEWMPIEK